MSLRNVVAVLTGVIVTVATGLMIWSASDAVGAEAPAGTDLLLSQGRPALASSVVDCCPAQHAVDGRFGSRWASAPGADPAWISVDLGGAAFVHRVTLLWDASCAAAYDLQTSDDGDTWTSIFSTTTARGGTESVDVNGNGRYLRVYLTRRCRTDPGQGYMLREFQVYGVSDNRVR
jgi:hypothetical protein